MCAKQKDYLPLQQEQESVRSQIKNFFLFSQKEVYWFLALLIVYQGINLFYYGMRKQIYYYFAVSLFALVSMRQLINQSFVYQMIFQMSALIMLNQPLVLCAHFIIQFLLNLQEKLPYSVPLLFASQFILLTISNFELAWIFVAVTLLLQTPQLIQKIQNSKLGCKLVVYANSVIFDLLISLPRNGYSNFVALIIVFIALLVYSKKFMTTAISKSYANSICFSVILRLVMSLLDGIILSSNIVYDNYEVLNNLVKWNGYFSICLSFVVQSISMLDLQEKISNWKYIVLIPILLIIIPLIALSPLCTTVSVFVLFISGFDLTDFGYIQQLCLQINAAYYNQPNWNWKVYTCQILCRIFAGVLVGSITIWILNFSYAEKFKIKINAFVSSAVAAFTGLFLGVPLLISSLNDGAITLGQSILLISIFLCITTIIFVNPGNVAVKVISFVLYGGLVVWSFLKTNISLGFIQLIFLVMVQTLPQSSFVLSLILAVVLMVTFINVRYSLLVIKYSDAVSVLSLIIIIFVVRYVMVKSTCIKRILLKTKVEHQGVKYQTQLLEDIFEDKQERQPALDVYHSLKFQMQIAVLVLQIVFCSWNFGALSVLFISLLVVLIPVDTQDQDGNIIQIGGYFGILEGWQINPNNLLQMRQNYFISVFISINVHIVFNFAQFVGLLFQEKFYEQGLTLFWRDLVIYIVIFVPCFLGLISATGCCQKIFVKLAELQRVKLFVLMGVLSLFTLIFATQSAIKMMAIFILLGGLFQAPSTIAAPKGKRVVHL